jgi:ATP synthase F1 delta subunit
LELTQEEIVVSQYLLSRESMDRALIIRALLKSLSGSKQYERIVSGLNFQSFFITFLTILCKNARVSMLNDIARLYRMLVDNELNRLSVTVYTAEPMSEENKTAMLPKLSKIFKKDIKITYEVDEKILGGILVRSDLMTIDVSVRHQIVEFTKRAKKFFDGDYT